MYKFHLIVSSVKIFSRGNNVNVSHVIHEFSFGPKYPGIHNPLDGTTRILHDTSGTVKYFVKVNGDFCRELKLIFFPASLHLLHSISNKS